MMCKVALRGDKGVGKTSLALRFTQKHFTDASDDSSDTRNYKKTASVDGQPCVFDILETSQEEEQKVMRDSYLRLYNSFLICFSMTDRSSFESLQARIDAIRKSFDSDDVPAVIVGCKGDLEKDRKVSESEAADFAHANRLECLITSAKSGVYVEEVFAALFRTKTRLQEAPAASDASKDKNPSRQRGSCTIQ